MDFAVNWLEGGTTLNVVSLVLGAAGVLLSIYFYIRSKHEKRPVFHAKTFPLLRDTVSRVPGLSILFDDKPVNTLSLTRLAIWNAGSRTIARDDIVKSDPLRIDGTAQGQILAARVSFSRRPATNLEASLVSNSILLSFDFLDRNDGGIIDIYHTEPLKIDVVGVLRGCQSISIADPTALWEQRVNKVLGRLPDPDSFKYVSILVLLLYVPLFVVLFIPLFGSLAYSKVFRSIPIEYSLESS
jgi:hypothetical protein